MKLTRRNAVKAAAAGFLGPFSSNPRSEPVNECDCSRVDPTSFTVTISDVSNGATCWEGTVVLPSTKPARGAG